MTNINPDALAAAQQLMQPVPANNHINVKQFADAVAAAPAAPGALDLDALIEQARADAALAPAAATKGRIEAPNPALANAILAAAAEQKRIADTATAEYDKAKAYFADLVLAAEEAAGVEPGAISEVAVNGAVVFTFGVTNQRTLNQKHIKAIFPDIPGNEECYTDSPRRNRVIK